VTAARKELLIRRLKVGHIYKQAHEELTSGAISTFVSLKTSARKTVQYRGHNNSVLRTVGRKMCWWQKESLTSGLAFMEGIENHTRGEHASCTAQKKLVALLMQADDVRSPISTKVTN